jgi:HSP20 family molecular chaperone IbpA
MSSGVRVVNDAHKFAVQMDVSQYRPEEIEVKVNDAEQGGQKYLMVSGKHEEQQDEYGHVSRSFTRRYALPPDVDAAQLACNMSEAGVLTAQAPRVQPAMVDGARAIPITHVAHAPKLATAAGQVDKKGKQDAK